MAKKQGLKNQIIYGWSTKSDGVIELTTDILGGAKFKNRASFFKFLPFKPKLVLAQLNHGTTIKVLRSARPVQIFKNTDALITPKRQILLNVTMADCFPVFFYDDQKKVIGIAHCGWRGTADRLSLLTAAKMLALGAKTLNLRAIIGPGIRNCHFEVKTDVAEKFTAYKKAIIKSKNKIFVDLAEVIKQQLIAAGIKSENIFDSEICTYCDKQNFFSFRRDQPKKLRAQMAFIVIG